jgi:hypothetical protein
MKKSADLSDLALPSTKDRLKAVILHILIGAGDQAA